jgi:MscS family membrane protein
VKRLGVLVFDKLLHGDIFTAAMIVISAIAIIIGIEIVHRAIRGHLHPDRYSLGASFADSIYLPAIIYVILSAILLIFRLDSIAKLTHIKSEVYSDTHTVLFVLFIVWTIFRFIVRMETVANARHKGKEGDSKRKLSTYRVMAQVSKFTIILMAAITTMQVFGIPITAFLTFGGIGSVVIGFAAKDSLSNLLGGLMIYLDHPFTAGDWILSPDRNIEGTVEHIGWRLTRIRTFDKRLMYIPNGIFSTITIENASKMSNRRIKTTIGVRYDDALKLPVLLADIKKMLQEHEEIDHTKTLLVNLVGFGDSALNILIYTFTKTIAWQPYQDVQEDVFLKILGIIAGHGAQCAFPTRQIQIEGKSSSEARESLI